MLGLFFSSCFNQVARQLVEQQRSRSRSKVLPPVNQVSNPSTRQLRVLINPWGKTKAEETKTEEFAAPKRPSPGELIVPQEPASTPPSPSIIVPSEEIAPLPIDLKPSDLAIYKVVRGDTLWGIARKMGYHYQFAQCQSQS